MDILFLYHGETVLCHVSLVFAVGVIGQLLGCGLSVFPWIFNAWDAGRTLNNRMTLTARAGFIFTGSNVKAWFISSISSFTSTPWRCEQEAQQETLEPYFEPDRSTMEPCTYIHHVGFTLLFRVIDLVLLQKVIGYLILEHRKSVMP